MLREFAVVDNNGREATGQALDFIRERIESFRLPQKEANRAQLMAEEALVRLVKHGNFEGGGAIQVNITRFLGSVTIELTAPGEEFAFESGIELGLPFGADKMTPKTAETIQNILLRVFKDKLKYSHRSLRDGRGFNSVSIKAIRSPHSLLYRTLTALCLAIILSAVLKNTASEEFLAALNSNFLIAGKTMFLNALKMVVAPVVFFSITSCIAQFDSFSEMGKVGLKVLLFYFLTTFAAITIGLFTFNLLKSWVIVSIPLPVSGAAAPAQAAISLKAVITGAIPSNFIAPFLEMNMLQIIFMSVLCGGSVAACGSFAPALRNFFEAGNALFLKVTTVLIKFVPFGTFCSISSLCLTTGTKTLISLAGMAGMFVIGVVGMVIFYCLLILLLNRLNPMAFLKKYLPVAVQCFCMNSSNASIPVNMGACEKLGVSRSIYSLSIPLGATINMHGTCIYLMVISLSLAKLYGVNISSASIASMFLSVFVLSVGSPGVSGAGLVCLSMLLDQLEVPIEGVGLIMGIDPLLSMMRSMSNCLGDVAGSVIVAGNNGLLDKDAYNKM
ncbi:MAG: cation:dicarboxylase symporter family transporter [Fretibacterium sp.]|nr:cation:dicarboxylase symporter family transporter [Fretibacterium sp.]